MNEESLLDCEVRWLLHRAGYSMCHVRSGLLSRRLLDARQPVAHDHAAPPFRGRLRCRAAWTLRRRRRDGGSGLAGSADEEAGSPHWVEVLQPFAVIAMLGAQVV